MEIRRNKVKHLSKLQCDVLSLFFPFSTKCFNCMDELDVTYHCTVPVFVLNVSIIFTMGHFFYRFFNIYIKKKDKPNKKQKQTKQNKKKTKQNKTKKNNLAQRTSHS